MQERNLDSAPFLLRQSEGLLHLPRASSLHKDTVWILVLGAQGRKLAIAEHLPHVRTPRMLMVLLLPRLLNSPQRASDIHLPGEESDSWGWGTSVGQERGVGSGRFCADPAAPLDPAIQLSCQWRRRKHAGGLCQRLGYSLLCTRQGSGGSVRIYSLTLAAAQ